MDYISVKHEQNIALVCLSRGKVNALCDKVVEEFSYVLKQLIKDPSVNAVIITSEGKFFSFGFDIPHFMDYSREAFTRYLEQFAALYTDLFIFPKPIIAALNGHTIAGGCMLATACDFRLMAAGKAKISLNEISFGSTVLAGSVEMLTRIVGHRQAEVILYSGAMYSAQEALAIGLIDRVCREETLYDEAMQLAEENAAIDARAFESIKLLLRKPTAGLMRQREPDSIRRFIEIWYSQQMRERLKKVEIRS
jgi:enoyl-CoA hydratase/carnithine racemase